MGDENYSMGGTYWQIQDFLTGLVAPTRIEIQSMLNEPAIRLVRVLKERTAQLETDEAELQEIAEIFSNPNFGRFG